MITHPDPHDAVREWFARLSACCAAVDFETAQTIFADDVVSFGTRADVVSGLLALRRNQWEGIWPNIRDFAVDLGSVRAGGNERLAWGVATWTSTGFHEDGRPFSRPGRATTVLERRPAGWVSVHTHFSLTPGTPPRTHGPGSPSTGGA